MTARLEALLLRATVRIGPEGAPDTLWGSGFFVAPGWVLTCAHVLRPAREPDQGGPSRVPEEGGPLRIRGHDRLDARGRLAYWLGGGTDPDQDLALIRLIDPADHACVRLTDRYDAPLAVTAHGWRVPNGGAPQRWKGQTECNGKDGAHGLTLAPLVEIPHGASGGPLLDRERGLVAGVVKARRTGKDGGLAVAVTALRGFRRAVPVGDERSLGNDPYAELIRAHDTWHQRARGALSWVRAQDDQCSARERRWGPRDSADACALLAALPPPDSSAELQGLIERVLGDEPLWEDDTAPQDWRDGQGWLYDHSEGPDIVSLHYLRVVARACAQRAPGAAAALERWVERRAEQLPYHLRALLMGVTAWAPGIGARGEADACAVPSVAVVLDPRGADEEGPVVAVELEPDLFRPHDRFHWRIWTWTGGPDTARALDQDTDGEGVPLADLPHLLNEPLSRAFGRLDTDRRARLELALPVEHFGVDVHLWRPSPVVRSLRPHPAERPFGVHRQVVLRCLKRRGEPLDVWRERWHGVAEGEPKALPVPSDAYAPRALTDAPPGAVPVLCRPPAESAATLSHAIAEGYGVILWSQRAEHAHGCGPDCLELHDRAAELLGSAGRATTLPERLRTLRERVSQADADADWAEHLALFYDDPRRPIPLCDDLLESP
ncbi:trypsin-like peptidase domain-containing protein [Streptomyces venetus]|uniref:Trypsin-like peptidase domain-containing protein n=1 Tax=Streptomyces venetus TaxID=1701086 RepID=A0ABP8F8I9_9ACTN